MAGGTDVGTGVFRVAVDPTGVVAGVNKAGAAIKGAGAQIEKGFGAQSSGIMGRFNGVLGGVSKSFEGVEHHGGLASSFLTGAGLGAGLMAFGAIKGALEGVVHMVDDFITAAKEAQVTEAKLDQSLKDNVPNWQAHTAEIDAAAKAGMNLGFTDLKVKDSIAQLVVHTDDVTKAVKLQAIAMDLARLRGLDLATATTIVGKVYDGHVAILNKFGIAVKKGATAEEALLAVQKAAGGQAAAYAKTEQGQTDAMNAKIEALRAKVGGALMGPMSALVGFMSGPVMDAVSGLIDGIGTLGTAFDNLHRFIDPDYAKFEDLRKAALDQAAAYGVDADALQAFIDKQKEAAAATDAAAASVVAARDAVDAHNTLLELQAQDMGITVDQLKAYQAAADATTQVQVDQTNTLQGLAASVSAYNDDLRETATLAGNEAAAQAAMGVAVDATATKVAASHVVWWQAKDAAIQATNAAKLQVIANFQGMANGVESVIGPKGSMLAAAKSGMDALHWAIKNPNAWKTTRATLTKDMAEAQKALALAIKQGRPEVVGQAQQTIAAIAAQQALLPPQSYHWGSLAGIRFADGLNSASGYISAAALNSANLVARHLQQRSPARAGPLSEGGGSRGWGEYAARIYGEGWDRGLTRWGGPKLSGFGAASGFRTLATSSSSTVRHEHSGTVRVAIDGRNLPLGTTNAGIAAIVNQALGSSMQGLDAALEKSVRMGSVEHARAMDF